MATNTALNSNDITQLGYVALQNYLKNKPIDQVAQERPLLKALTAKKKPWGGGKENIVEQLRTGYDSNFQWFGEHATTKNTTDTVTYNTRDTVRQAYWPWCSAHDGFYFTEDFLLGNGIIVTDSAPRNSSSAGLVQLTNIFNEGMETLRLGFEEILDLSLHLDGTIDPGGSGSSSSGRIINGLDFIVDIKDTSSTVGGITKTAHTGSNYWNNHWNDGSGLNDTGATGTGVTTATLLDSMTAMWRECQKNGGSPDIILAGSTFIDNFREAANSAVSRYAVQPTQQAQMPWNLDPSVEVKNGGTFTGLYFQGVPILWDPSFDGGCTTKDSSATYAWKRRCYFLNSNHLCLRPIEGNDMVARKPPRQYNKYEYYWGMTWRGSLTANRLNCHGLIWSAA
jgi:hypothetical protein